MVGRSDNRGGGGGLAGKDRADFDNTHIVATWRVGDRTAAVAGAVSKSVRDDWSQATGVKRLSRNDCPGVTAPE